jgi:magnesium transporter
MGIIPHDILVEASKEQATLDIVTMTGASKDERALSTPWFAIKKRLPWLEINLLTAFLAASVVGLFEDTIATFTVLAVLLPIVAGQSGNTGSQALAVTIRGLALREIHTDQWLSILFKEGWIGLFNGLAVALTTSLGVFIWSGSSGLAFIIGVSMILSMFIASIAGAAVPLVLSACKQDPAQSSSVILTTITDVAGFSSFLGIATLLSSLLLK